jgi:acyl-CoA synthetase (NDP forming)
VSSPLAPLLDARSVAVIGASARRGSLGHRLVRQLLGGGFQGPVYPVNPHYDQVLGIECHPTIGSVPEPVDLVAMAIPNEALEGEFEAATVAGAGSLAVFASCIGPASDGAPLSTRLGDLAREANLPVCGGNGMGFLNLDSGLRVCGYHQPWGLRPGPVTFLSHSGSLFSAMLHNRRGLDFNLVVSTGNEMATTMDAYLEYSLDMASTRAIGLFVETVRHPERMAAALDRAWASGVPVVALKVGRTDRGRAAVTTHSAAIAGDGAVAHAFFEAHGVAVVESMDEMADTLELFSAGRAAAPGGLGVVLDSGGERALMIDLAESVGVALPHVSDATRARLAAALDPGLEPENPVDAWGTGNGFEDGFADCLSALAADPSIGAVVLAVDLTEEEVAEEGYEATASALAAHTTKPVAVLCNLAAAVDPEQAAIVRAAGVPILRGTETGLRAIRHLFERRDHRHRRVDSVPIEGLDPFVERLRRGEVLGELEALAMLARCGLTVVDTVQANGADEAVAAAAQIGYPVAVKTASAFHKTDVGGVVLHLNDSDAVRAAVGKLAHLGERFVVQQMAPAGVELALGAVVDPQFGPLVMVAAGGVLVEVLGDRALGLAPMDEAGAAALVSRLAVTPLLKGVRGAPPVDTGSLVAALVDVSRLVSQTRDVVGSLDVNPVIVHPGGCVAVDALVTPAQA